MSDWPYKSAPVITEDEHSPRTGGVECVNHHKTVVPPDIDDECDDLSELGISLPDSDDDR